LERRLAAILAADVAGYTALMGANEAGTLQRLTELRREFLEPLIDEYHGRIVKLMGDGLLVEFASVVDAVTCALAWQYGVAEREAASDEDNPLRFRIGINLGDVIVEGGDIHGDGVNIAARLEGLADPGGICMSVDAFRQARGKTEAQFEDLGERKLKNVTEPVRVYRIATAKSGKAAIQRKNKLTPMPDKPSIAVLPFTNMSGDPEQEYFSDGITEDIITELSRFSSLFVIARNSTFSYKGKSVEVRQIAEELGVRYVLEGSIRRAGNRLRINAQLIDSETGGHIWAERYDRQVEDVFDLQKEITHNVVSSIAPQIEIAEIERVRRVHGENISAYELALKAKALLFDGSRTTNHETLEQAIETAQQALNLDPRSVQALWVQGFAYHLLYTCRLGVEPDETLDRAWRIVERLAEIDSSNSYACMIRGTICWDRGEHEVAIAQFRRAYALNPNFAWNLVSMAWCESLAGLTTEAKEHAELGLRLSPRDMDFWLGTAYLALAQASFAEGDFQTARDMGNLSIEMHAKAPIRRCIVIASCGHLGEVSSAAHHLKELRSFSPGYVPNIIHGDIALYTLPEHNRLLVEGINKVEPTQQ